MNLSKADLTALKKTFQSMIGENDQNQAHIRDQWAKLSLETKMLALFRLCIGPKSDSPFEKWVYNIALSQIINSMTGSFDELFAQMEELCKS